MASKIRCHYEVLGVDFNVNSDDLKKVYRKLALKYHPDKNRDNVDEATAQFRLVQQAYEVLSDPQERAWYDKHREEILRGGMGGGDKYDDDSLNLFQYFNSTCYSGFGEDEKGFYAVYAKVFETIAEEDYVFMEDRKKDEEFPKFGCPTSDYDEVVGPFYAFWAGFCTSKSYVWKDKYDTRDAPDRRCRRAMEIENKKFRDAAKKERNEEIRNLVAYVKKRDKRVQAYKKKMEERAAEIEKKAKAKREEDLLERKRRMENYQETEWSAMSGLEREMEALEAHLDDHFGNSSSDDDLKVGSDKAEFSFDPEDFFNDDLYCVACDKGFKSEKARFNHEKSKKHKEMVKQLIQEMQEDEDDNEDSEDDQNLEDVKDLENIENSEKEEENSVQLQTEGDVVTNDDEKIKNGFDENIEDEDVILSSDEEEEPVRLSKKQKKKRRQKTSTLDQDTNHLMSEKVESASIPNDCPSKSSSKSKKAKRRAAKNSQVVDEVEMSEQKDVTENGARVEHAQEKKETDLVEEDQEKLVEGGETESKQSKAEKAPSKEKQKKPKSDWKCQVCRKEFPSRNKMFDHIKQTGHAVLIEAPKKETGEESGASEQGKGKKGKKKR